MDEMKSVTRGLGVNNDEAQVSEGGIGRRHGTMENLDGLIYWVERKRNAEIPWKERVDPWPL